MIPVRTLSMFAACAFFGSIVSAQVPEVEWEWFLDGNFEDLYSVRQSTEGGYIAAGDQIIKLNSRGFLDRTWPVNPRAFEGVARSVQQSTDGGYIVAGQSVVVGISDVYLIKLTSRGVLDRTWPVNPKTFGGRSYDRAFSVQQTEDGGYIVAGETYSSGAGASDVYLIKLDIRGNLDPTWPVNPRTFGGADDDAAYSVQQTEDGGYIVAGETESFGAGAVDVYLINLDARGDLDPTWTDNPKTFGDTGYNRARSVQQTEDGGYIVAGESVGNVYLSKLDVRGDLDPTWTDNPKILGTPNSNDGANSVQQTADGGYIVAGHFGPVFLEINQVYIVKLAPVEPPTQLQIYLPGEGIFVELQSRIQDAYFDENVGTIVMTHGWDGSAPNDGWLLELARAFNSHIDSNVNILAWDWSEQAGTGILDPYGAAKHVPSQSLKCASALERVLSLEYDQPVHFMGHSFGAYLMANVCEKTLALRSGVEGVLAPTHLTFWDPPDLVINALSRQVLELRTAGVYTDLYSGVTNSKTHYVHAWVSIPFENLNIFGHDAYNWYRQYSSFGQRPFLFATGCDEGPFPNNTGFRASPLFGEAALPLRLPCPEESYDVSLVFNKLDCPPRNYTVSGKYCLFWADAPPVEEDTPLTDGQCSGQCESQGDTGVTLGAMRALQGKGAGEDSVDTEFVLPAFIDRSWDSVSFTYEFSERGRSTVAFSVRTADEALPFWVDDASVEPGPNNSGRINISSFHGQDVEFVFGFTAEPATATVTVSDVSFWQDPFHDNREPVVAVTDSLLLAVGADGPVTTVTLDASPSTDSDGDELLTIWENSEGIVEIAPSFTDDYALGAYEYTVTVRDPFDGISQARVLREVEYPFVRGDSNADGRFDISDPITTLTKLFLDGSRRICADAADSNDDNSMDISDAVYSLRHLFTGAPAPLAPFPEPGLDPTPDTLGCDVLRP